MQTTSVSLRFPLLLRSQLQLKLSLSMTMMLMSLSSSLLINIVSASNELAISPFERELRNDVRNSKSINSIDEINIINNLNQQQTLTIADTNAEAQFLQNSSPNKYPASSSSAAQEVADIQQKDSPLLNATFANQQNISSSNDNSRSNNTSEPIDVSFLEAISDEKYLQHSMAVSVITTFAYSIVVVVGVIGNSFVVIIVCRSPRMRTVTNYFIVNLALADILVLVFCLPPTLVGNILRPYVLGRWVCKTASYLQGVAVSASINTMVVVTMDRFLAICFPMDWHMSRRDARSAITCIWLFSLTISLPWGIYFTLKPVEHNNITVSMCIEDWPSERVGNMYFIFANLILCYLLPAALVIFCYLGIWYKIERRSIPGDRPAGLKVELIMQKSKIKVVKMMIVVVMAFLLSWLPTYIIFVRIKLISEELSEQENWLISNAMPLAQWLGASNSCINPVLYTFFNRKYRDGFVDLIRRSFCCYVPVLQEAQSQRDICLMRSNERPNALAASPAATAVTNAATTSSAAAQVNKRQLVSANGNAIVIGMNSLDQRSAPPPLKQPLHNNTSHHQLVKQRNGFGNSQHHKQKLEQQFSSRISANGSITLGSQVKRPDFYLANSEEMDTKSTAQSAIGDNKVSRSSSHLKRRLSADSRVTFAKINSLRLATAASSAKNQNNLDRLSSPSSRARHHSNKSISSGEWWLDESSFTNTVMTHNSSTTNPTAATPSWLKIKPNSSKSISTCSASNSTINVWMRRGLSSSDSSRKMSRSYDALSAHVSLPCGFISTQDRPTTL